MIRECPQCGKQFPNKNGYIIHTNRKYPCVREETILESLERRLKAVEENNSKLLQLLETKLGVKIEYIL